MKKVTNQARMIAFIATVISTIPLFFTYLTNTQPKNEFVIDLHVWFGLIFIVMSVVNMFHEKRKKL
jgi:hypothetical protein